tara:strand:- start:3022 stop:3411 length:390 start_codon:yes stop_codon:yes gene_type:complete
MFTLITVSFSLCFIALTGWTITTYFVKEDSQKVIEEELKNLFNISNKFFASLKSLIVFLAKTSFSYDSSETKLVEYNESNDNPLDLVQPAKKVESNSLEVPNKEYDDIALSSFSPEVVELIEEEEEKVA